jgi:hypothetical protein
MTISWLWLWMVFMFVFLLSPVGYGWGYRGWGVPYPRYVQRRRSQNAPQGGDRVPVNHHAWGWGGDFIWIMLAIWILWFGVGVWYR